MVEVFDVLFRSGIAVLTVIFWVRLVGLRAFSKMTSFDFALTVAVGSLIATMIFSLDTPVRVGVASLSAVFAVQFALSLVRRRSRGFEDMLDNTPLLLMRDGEFLEENLRAARVARTDVVAKLREANALCLKDVHAVVLEATGDISVLHGRDGAPPDLDILLDGVRGA